MSRRGLAVFPVIVTRELVGFAVMLALVKGALPAPPPNTNRLAPNSPLEVIAEDEEK